jgi:hypothetical protein
VKNVKSDRDSSVSRLIAEALEAHAVSEPGAACLDAETLAAWTDDTLGSRERARAEAHLGRCARCQALMAVMMKTTPPAVAGKTAWRIPALRWLIPLTAAATAVLVWAIVPDRVTLPQEDRPAPAAVDRVAALPAPAASASAKLDAQPQGRPATPQGRLTASQGRPTASRALADTSALQSARRQGDAIPEEQKADAPHKLELETRELATASDKAVAETIVVNGAVLGKQSPAVAASPVAAPAPATSGRSVAVARAAPGGTVIVSSNRINQWRIVSDGAVQRSIDGGLTWQTQETGATATLAAGASPSPSVCWLVGPGGAVLLSTDGRSWQRITFPEATDLISVRATDDRTATVIASDGRTFTTSDGGRTWVR